MTAFVVIQPIMIVIGSYFYDEMGSVIGYVLAIYLMNFGYILIAIKLFIKKKIFFKK